MNNNFNAKKMRFFGEKTLDTRHSAWLSMKPIRFSCFASVNDVLAAGRECVCPTETATQSLPDDAFESDEFCVPFDLEVGHDLPCINMTRSFPNHNDQCDSGKLKNQNTNRFMNTLFRFLNLKVSWSKATLLLTGWMRPLFMMAAELT